MPDVKKAQKEAEEVKEVSYTPFGTPIREEVAQDCSQKEIAQFGLELDKETGSTHVVLKDPLDLDALIQTYKDQCGMELAQLQIRRGLATPDDFAAQPGDYGDTSTLPDNINDAYRASLEAKKSGINLEQFKTDADIEAYVKAQVKAQLQAQAKAAQGSQTAPNSNQEAQ